MNSSSIVVMMPGIRNIFNIVLSIRYVPTVWCLGLICQKYKNKGSIGEPDNLRGISLLICTCKLFTACLNSRLF